MDVVADILEKSAKDAEKYKSIDVKKHLEVEFDLGTLMAVDSNDLDANLLSRNKNDYIQGLTRDNVQLLLNKIWELPTERVEETICAKLPEPKTILPRSKRVPRPKALTKWQQFAKEKGITKKKKSKLSWDEQLQKWIPLYGYKRAAAQKDKDWVIEVPQNADPFEDQFAKKAQFKDERVAKNELQRLRNIAKAKNIKIPRTGLLNPDMSNAKELQTAVTVARSSTASLGKFQNRLPKEKEARGVADITPGASRKRKMPPVSGQQERSENLALVDSVLNKKPKLNIEKAVAQHMHIEDASRSEEKRNEKPRAGKRGKKKSSGSGKKPKGGKGIHKGLNAGGRKRR